LIRSHVLNFVAYAGGNSVEPGTREQLIKLVDYIATKYRARAVLVIGHEGAAAAAIECTVSARAQHSADGRKIVHELVQINADGPVGESVPSIVLPLLISDLPTYVWWPGDPQVEHSFWRCMAGACQHLVLNSCEFSNPLEKMSQLAGSYKGARMRPTFGDLSWNQLAPWRELVAQFFDNQSYRPYLDGVETVDIEYSGGTKQEAAGGIANPCPALLLSGWLCSRLGWEAIDCTQRDAGFDFTCSCKASGRKVTVHFKSRLTADGMPVAIDAVRLKTAASEVQAYFEVVRKEQGSVARVAAHVDGMTESARSVRLVTVDLPELLAKHLEFRGRDEQFGAALAVAGDMATLALNQRSR
jgi:glucose-6-phosphate dehydrogenase assembly protein OpcA